MLEVTSVRKPVPCGKPARKAVLRHQKGGGSVQLLPSKPGNAMDRTGTFTDQWINVIFGFLMISPFLYKRLYTADEVRGCGAIITHWQNDVIGSS